MLMSTNESYFRKSKTVPEPAFLQMPDSISFATFAEGSLFLNAVYSSKMIRSKSQIRQKVA